MRSHRLLSALALALALALVPAGAAGEPTTANYVFATFLGGSSGDAATAVAVDDADRIYVAGFT